jgi:hypothetical protein
VTDFVETSAPTPPTKEGGVWLRITAGDATDAHGWAEWRLNGGGGRNNVLVCRCGDTLSGAPYTLGYRDRGVTPAGRANIFQQHLRRTAGLCVHCGKDSCWCDMTIGT